MEQKVRYIWLRLCTLLSYLEALCTVILPLCDVVYTGSLIWLLLFVCVFKNTPVTGGVGILHRVKDGKHHYEVDTVFKDGKDKTRFFMRFTFYCSQYSCIPHSANILTVFFLDYIYCICWCCHAHHMKTVWQYTYVKCLRDWNVSVAVH